MPIVDSDVSYGIKFGYKNIGWGGKFYMFPYFLAFLLKRFLKEAGHPVQTKTPDLEKRSVGGREHRV